MSKNYKQVSLEVMVMQSRKDMLGLKTENLEFIWTPN
jgi:hypothetical protein